MDKKTKIILSIATVIVIIALITVLATRNNQSDKSDFTPPPFEVNAQLGEIDNTDTYYGEFELPYDDGNKCNVGLEAMPTVEDDELKIDFSSDKENTVWVRLVLTNKNDEVVCESGILKPGEYVKKLKLTKPISDERELNAKILTFEPETYYSVGSASATLKLK